MIVPIVFWRHKVLLFEAGPRLQVQSETKRQGVLFGFLHRNYLVLAVFVFQNHFNAFFRFLKQSVTVPTVADTFLKSLQRFF